MSIKNWLGNFTTALWHWLGNLTTSLGNFTMDLGHLILDFGDWVEHLIMGLGHWPGNFARDTWHWLVSFNKSQREQEEEIIEELRMQLQEKGKITMRQEFVMSVEQHRKLLNACKPVPYMIVGGMQPRSPQENANAAWEALGKEMGFDPHTVQPISGKSEMHFTAEPVSGQNGSI